MADKKISALTAATTPLAGTEVLPIVQGGATVKVAVSNLTAGRTVNATQYTSTVSEASQQAISCISANLNTVVTNGSYAGYSATNTPESTAAWVFLTVTSNGTDQIYQTCAIAGYVNGQTYKRFSADSGATWTSWVLISANTTGNIAFANGLGIDFSATPGTGTSELLADYEEGTWTPVVAATSGIIISYTASGTYTKVGRLVTATFTYNITSVGTGTGAITVTAPFTAGSGALYPTGSSREVAVAGWGGYTGIDPSGTTITVQKYDGGFAGSTGVVVRGTISYQV